MAKSPFLLPALLLSILAPAQAQICTDVSGVPGVPAYTGLATSVPGSRNCVGWWSCFQATTTGTSYTLSPSGCDPTSTTCTATAAVTAQFPGNKESYFPTFPPPGFQAPPDSLVKLVWTNGNAQLTGTCGSAIAKITNDEAIASLSLPFGCSDAAANPNLYQFTLAINTCQGLTFCSGHSRTVNVNFGPGSGLCPEPPPEEDCRDESGCKLCKSTGGGGPGGGGASAGGGGGTGGGFGTGPGARLRYKAGGIGRSNLPGAAFWAPELGRYWSHDYAERIFESSNPAPAVSKVYLITDSGVFRTFSDMAGDGVYEVKKPSSIYETLEEAPGGGWTLTYLDGTIKTFNADGRWTATTDRFGNAKTGTYTLDKLTEVAFPDGRREDLTYHPSGKLASISEVGVDGSTTRTWSYTWTGDDLTRIDMPDGRALEYFYTDASHPGFMTRTELVGEDGTSRRVTAAWEYDAFGNVYRLWKGATTYASGVEKWQFTFDDPVVPRKTTVTDPLGNVATYDLDTVRSSRTEQAKLVKLTGDCPTCGTGPNSQLFYQDPTNPYRITREVNGRGYETHSTWNSFGQLTERIEAVSSPVERSTNWTYDANFPALWTSIEQPSTTGIVTDIRRSERAYDASGRLLSETIEGIEAAAPFSLTTSYTPTTEGLTGTIDPPGYGTTDQTSFTYDPTRGNLVALTRTDPLVGTTTYGYDAFNRRTSITDVNGVVTETTYDDLDRVLTVTHKGATVADDRITESRYNTFGDLFQTVLPEGNVIEYGYDSAGRLISVERKPDDQPTSHGERTFYTLNGAGMRTLEQRQSWNGAWVTATQTAWQYSSRCQLDKTTDGLPGEQSVTEQAYDCNGNVIKVWDANHPSAGQTATPSTSYEYDELDRLKLARQPFGGAGGGNVDTTYLYDNQDHLIQVTDANGTVTGYVYSDRDLQTREVSEVSGTSNHTYNEHGQLTITLDARGIMTFRVPDELDRVTSVDLPGTELDVAFAYDDPFVPFSKGRLTSLTRGATRIDYEYDRFGRTTQDGELGYTFDKNGNATTLTYPGGLVATYTHNYADRPQTLSVTPAGGTPQAIVTAASHRPSGPISSLTLGNGLTETRDFDSRSFPKGILVPGRLDWDYTLDAVGNPTAITDALAPANNKTYAYQNYQYFLTTGNGPWGTRSWTYDKVGNRLTETRSGVTDTYSYVSNAAMGRSPKLQQIALGAGGTTAFTYDSAGNETVAGTSTRTFNDAGHLGAAANAPAQTSSNFRYDGRGFLVEAKGNAPATGGSGVFCDGFESGDTSQWGTGPGEACTERTVTFSTYGSEGRLYQVRRGGGRSSVLYFEDRPVALVEDGALGISYRLLTTDHLGTPVLATNTGGTALWSGGFEPFGRDWNGAQAAGVYLRFPGQWTDQIWEAAGVYNTNRWYQAPIGRFSQIDPSGLPRTGVAPGERAWEGRDINTYSYAFQRPPHFADPSGLAVTTFGCNAAQEAKLQKAAQDADAAGATCLPCEDRAPFRRELRSKGTPRELVFECVPWNVNPNTGNTVCGVERTYADKILITPFGMGEVPGCGCLKATILHEVTHRIGYSEPEAREAEAKCFKCSS